MDGHDFIPAVFEKGALAVLSERELSEPKGPYILVDSTEDAMKKIAAFYRRALSVKVVGITGSVGKTSTKEMVASVLAQKYNVLKTEGNLNNEIGLPLTIFKIREEHEVAVGYVFRPERALHARVVGGLRGGDIGGHGFLQSEH